MIDTSGWDWGDVPTWVGALTTLGALIAAGFVVRIELRRDAQARREAHDRANRAERAEQADSVAAWTETGTGVWAVVRNSSPLPIYDAWLNLDVEGLEFFSSADRDAAKYQAKLGIVPPGEQLVSIVQNLKGTDVRRSADGRPLRLRLSFKDTGGRNWERDEDGHLWRRIDDADQGA